jgi:hypothetical protein
MTPACDLHDEQNTIVMMMVMVPVVLHFLVTLWAGSSTTHPI